MLRLPGIPVASMLGLTGYYLSSGSVGCSMGLTKYFLFAANPNKLIAEVPVHPDLQTYARLQHLPFPKVELLTITSELTMPGPTSVRLRRMKANV